MSPADLAYKAVTNLLGLLYSEQVFLKQVYLEKPK